MAKYHYSKIFQINVLMPECIVIILMKIRHKRKRYGPEEGCFSGLDPGLPVEGDADQRGDITIRFCQNVKTTA